MDPKNSSDKDAQSYSREKRRAMQDAIKAEILRSGYPAEGVAVARKYENENGNFLVFFIEVPEEAIPFCNVVVNGSIMKRELQDILSERESVCISTNADEMPVLREQREEIISNERKFFDTYYNCVIIDFSDLSPEEHQIIVGGFEDYITHC